jgi:hypothetical protein
VFTVKSLRSMYGREVVDEVRARDVGGGAPNGGRSIAHSKNVST